MEMTERKKKVLRSIVDLYIRTAEPVGSKAIAEMPDVNYSSATIRNEMADLTAMGYLEQPHTSAGRIPSAAGYRLYVDELMLDYRLSMDETHSINAAIEELKEKGVWIFGTAAEGSIPMYQADLTGPAAIVIGSEGEGMSRLVQKNCDVTVHIPMAGRITSLNASAAASILLYEAVRQRLQK